ncbi:hypothetical protein K439DRAFT_1409815 [Ramaria rubella]|nr:hypothetical protein K439DRAFT_1409815 [Ramaria rubella]
MSVPTPSPQTAIEDIESKNHDALKRKLNACRTYFLKIWKTLGGPLDWIPEHCTFSCLKPVIRCAVAAWISFILYLIPRVNAHLGSAGFFILISVFLSPPFEPLAAVVEKEVITLLFVLTTWAWSCLAIKLANLARTTFDPNPTMIQVLSGQFIEAAPSVICAIFLFFGTAIILYARARIGPGPFTPATAFACLCADISLTVAPLYPYPYYNAGRTVVITLSFHVAISLATSLLVFPESVNAQFVKRLRAVLAPLACGIKQQHALLHALPLTGNFDHSAFTKEVSRADAALGPLAASSRLIKRDVSWGLLSGSDLRGLQFFGRKLTLRAAGLEHFYRIMDARHETFPHPPHPNSSLSSQFVTPVATPIVSQHPSPAVSDDEDTESPVDLHDTRKETHSWNGVHSSSHENKQKPLHRRNHHSRLPRHHLLRGALAQSQQQRPVGIFESQHHMNVEKRIRHPREEVIEEKSLGLLADSVEELLGETALAMDHILNWLDRTNSDRLRLRPLKEQVRNDILLSHERTIKRLKDAMDQFLSHKRHKILGPYRGFLDPLRESTLHPPHRYLFRSYLYQFHLLQFCESIHDMLQDIERLDKHRNHRRLWPPVLPLKRILRWSAWEPNEATERACDENPDIIPGVCAQSQVLGATESRDPDALPPNNVVELFGSHLCALLHGLTSRDAQFGLKGGILSVLLSLPSYFPNSTLFAYRNISIWAIYTAQVTLARYRGDTIFGFLSRLSSTFFGGLVGLAFWYISSGSGKGNPYGIAGVAAIILPLLMFVRVHAPGPPATVEIFAITTTLIVGYSWEDTHTHNLSTAGYGLSVSWRRFLLIAIGVTSSAIFSFLPPATTIRRYHRTALATATSEIGLMYCAIMSYAHTRKEDEFKDIIKNSVALRAKLRRLHDHTTYVQYEVSLAGKWPQDRYKVLLDIQLEIAYLLSDFASVVEQLEPSWSRAFLQRTRFVDSEFLGDALAVISLISTALRTATPLPQITPSPLLDRFWRDHPGLKILQQEVADELGLPKTVTLETLQNEQYMYFSVGVSCAHGIVSRLDRLMLATKELVGERFHIDGIRLPSVSIPKFDEGADTDKKRVSFDSIGQTSDQSERLMGYEGASEQMAQRCISTS